MKLHHSQSIKKLFLTKYLSSVADFLSAIITILYKSTFGFVDILKFIPMATLHGLLNEVLE